MRTGTADMRGERDLDVLLRGRAELADLRAFMHGYRRPGHDRLQREVRWAAVLATVDGCRLRRVLLGSAGRGSWSCW
jgi:hypothetical protein